MTLSHMYIKISNSPDLNKKQESGEQDKLFFQPPLSNQASKGEVGG